MDSKIYGIATAAALLLGANTAAAGGPVVLDDAALDAVTAAGGVTFNNNVNSNLFIQKNVNVNVFKNVFSNVNVTGRLATASASADAIGSPNVLAETETFAQVTATEAFSFSDALAASIGSNGGENGTED